MHANGLPVMRLMRWMPYEASFVPIPADTNVGVGRDAKPETIEIKVADKPQTAEREKGAKMSDKAEMSAKDAAEAFAAGEVAGMSVKDVREMIDGGKSLAEIKDVAFRKLQAANEVAKAKAEVKLDEKQVREYSLINVIRSFIPGSRVDIGFEREVSDECAKHTGKRGFIIPHAVLGRRDLTKSGTSSASIATNLLASDYIDALRSKMVLAPLGVRFMGGLVGDVAIPKLGTLTGYWVQESSTITESAQTMGQVTGTPKTCGVTVDISRKMLLQSTPSAEDFCRNEIVERIARTVQIAVFQGTGANGQPSAITAATGINNPSVTQGTPTYAELLGFPGSIMADNAEGSAMKAVMTAEVWQKLAATFTDGTAKAERVLDYNSKTFLGFPYFVSEDVGANSLFFGDWSNVVVGLWGNGVEINADTASLSTQGALRLVGLQDVDVMVRNGQGLAYNSAVTN
jgi:HK97 family phage major capsid protein